jgi:DNA polymerase I-like protein with 3'-5' exonuclease and polymerase domains/uracil-DNA glycosylase
MSFEVRDPKYIGPYGPLGARVMILGECPTLDDIAAGKPFAKSRELDSCLREAGIVKGNCWLSTVSKYHVPPNFSKKKKIPFHVRAKNAGIDMDAQLRELQTEINSLQPTAILGIGKTALWALTGQTDISSYRGSIMLGMGRKFIPTYNPEHLGWQAKDVEFMGYWNKQIIMADLRRFVVESKKPDLDLPSRHIHICQSSYELAEFRRQYKGKWRLSVDIEAGGHYLPICIGLAYNKHHAMVVPLWNVDGICNIPDADMVQIYMILAEMLNESDIIGQNFNYDRDKILRIGFIIQRLISDTMLKAFALHPELPVGLAFNTSIYTREPFYKNEGMYHGKLIDLLKGCGRDACVTFELDEVMEKDLTEIGQHKFFYNFLMKLPDFYWEREKQGFRIDKVRQEELMRKYIAWSEKIKHRLYQITGTNINVNSNKQIPSLLFDNWGLPRRDGTGEEELTAILNLQSLAKVWKKNPEYKEGIELILEGRRVNRTISNNIMVLPDFDGRVRTTIFPCLNTGRSSNGQQDEPIRPTIEVINLSGKKVKKSLGTPFQTMTKHGDIGQDIRSQYIPDELIRTPEEEAQLEWARLNDQTLYAQLIEDEYVFVQADSAQAEARIVFLLADDEWALEAIDKHDFHALTASWFFGGTEDDHSKKKRRAAISVNTDARKFKINIAIDEATAERALKIFHAKQPRIQQVFQASVIKCLERDRTLVAPIPFGFDSPVGGRRLFFERWGEELFREAFSYIPQRSISDNTKGAGIRIRERIPKIRIVMESHDSLLFCIRRSQLASQVPIIRQEMERPIDFRTCCIQRRSIVIPCEIETGKNYQDLKTKWKFEDDSIQQPALFDGAGNRILQSKNKPLELLTAKELSATERFMAPASVQSFQESKMTNDIYRAQQRKWTED